MRVLLTGIDGFVGSHAAEFLLAPPKAEVHGTVLDPAQTPNLDAIRSSLHLHQADILDPARLASLFREIRPDRVLHFAGQAFVPASIQDPVGTLQVNILGGVAVLEAARRMAEAGPAPAVLIISTGEVYGLVDPPERQPITEDCAIQPNNPYAASKASLDLIAQQYGAHFGVPVTVVRPFNHAGPRQSPIFVCSDFARQIAEIAAGKREPTMHVGNISTRRDFTDVRDVVRAYWMLFDRTSRNVVFNVCSGRAMEIRAILDMLGEISGIRVKIVSEERRFRSYDVPLVVGSYDRLRRATGWEPTIPFRKTLEDVYAYWQQRVVQAG